MTTIQLVLCVVVLMLNSHLFNDRDIGKPEDYYKDMRFFEIFIDMADSYLPCSDDEFYKYKEFS